MFKDIIHTIGARYLVALLNLLLIFINSKVLGPEKMGMVGLIYASANLAAIFNSILCGNTLIYFMNRYNLRIVFYPAYVWSFVGSAVACGLMCFFHMLPEGYEWIVFVLAVLMSLVTSNSLMLLGKDHVKGFNRTFILQGISMFLLLLMVYYIADCKHVKGYLLGLFVAHLVAYLYSLILLSPFLRSKANRPVSNTFFGILKEMFVFGSWNSVDNLAEGLTTRLNYFLVQNTGGYGNVGLLDSGTKISESVWHISNSISYIEYNRVSKTTDKQEQKKVTLQLFKLTYCTLLLVMALVVCVPEWVYTDYLLTPEFVGIRDIIIGLSVGIVAFGSNRILSHYFVGSGNVKYGTCCSVFGLFILGVAGFWLIPVYGVYGAAVTSSIAYVAMLIFSVIGFLRKSNTSFGELIPTRADWHELRNKIRSRKDPADLI